MQLQKLTGPSLVKKSVKAPSWASSSCINISIWPFRYSYKLCQYHINVYRNLWHPHETSVYWDKVPQVKRNYPRTGSHTRTVVIYSHSFWSKHMSFFLSNTKCESTVNLDHLQWMGAVRMRVWLKHHNNPHHSSPSVNVLWSQKLCVCKKSKTALNKYVDGFWRERTTGDGLFHRRKLCYRLWIYILARSDDLKLKLSYWFFFFFLNMQLFTSQDVKTCVLLWCFYLFGLSFWRHPFTAEHQLVSKWGNARILQIWRRN